MNRRPMTERRNQMLTPGGNNHVDPEFLRSIQQAPRMPTPAEAQAMLQQQIQARVDRVLAFRDHAALACVGHFLDKEQSLYVADEGERYKVLGDKSKHIAERLAVSLGYVPNVEWFRKFDVRYDDLLANVTTEQGDEHKKTAHDTVPI